jgi:hypothetical protein
MRTPPEEYRLDDFCDVRLSRTLRVRSPRRPHSRIKSSNVSVLSGTASARSSTTNRNAEWQCRNSFAPASCCIKSRHSCIDGEGSEYTSRAPHVKACGKSNTGKEGSSGHLAIHFRIKS